MTRGGAPDIDYVIDAKGRRVGKRVDGSLRKQYVWGGPLRVAAELNTDGAVASRFIYGNSITTPDLIVRRDTGSPDRLYRVISDHLGSPVYVVNIANPSDVWLDATYDEWGNVTKFVLDGVEQSDTSDWPIPQGFAGGLYDADTGLVRFGVRDYDPGIGRWTAKDPILFEGGQGNLFAYAFSDPVNFQDPDGRNAALVGITGAVGAATGIISYALTADGGSMDFGDWARGAAGALVGGAISGASIAYGPTSAAFGGGIGSMVSDWIAGKDVSAEGALLNAALNPLGAFGLQAAAGKFATGGLLASKDVVDVARSLQIRNALFGIPSGVVIGVTSNLLVDCTRKER